VSYPFPPTSHGHEKEEGQQEKGSRQEEEVLEEKEQEIILSDIERCSGNGSPLFVY
jgi:hypothetical protein